MTLVILFGASGDLASKKIFPALWQLHKNGHLPSELKVVGVARTKKTRDTFLASLELHCKVAAEDQQFGAFCQKVSYYSAAYTDAAFEDFAQYLEQQGLAKLPNRILYFALPPSTYTKVAILARKHCMSEQGYTRVVLEKPFGYDLASSRTLNTEILSLFDEKHIFRIDHYLGKEMVQNLLSIRFANFVISSLWSRDYISSVVISFKENIGTDGRGQYYDQSGVIRDVFQNHMIQVFTLVAMEPPDSLEATAVIDSKSNVLKQVLPIQPDNVVVGQYVGNPNAATGSPESRGYKDDPLVPPESTTATFASMVLYVDNDRWRGVPFILKAGKALNERKAEIRIQFKPVTKPLFPKRTINELVMRMQPNEAIYLKMQLKMPGVHFETAMSELDLTYKERHKEFKVLDAYEKLILDVIQGSHINFVRSDELEQAWKIFTPLLEHFENGSVRPVLYEFGSRGPKEADALSQKVGFRYDSDYKWSK